MVDWKALGTTQDELDLQLSKVKIKLFLKKGAVFLASIMGQTEFQWSEQVPTAATNGIKIWFNPQFWMKLPDETRVTVMAHELWHIAYQHMLRRSNRDPEKWNIAADHVINLALEADGFKFDGTNPVKDSKYKDMGTEEIYEILPNPPAQPKSGGGGNQQGKDMAGDLMDVPADQEMEIISKVIQATQAAQMAGQPGSIPGEIQLALDKFLNPKLPWQILLRRFFTEQSREDYSWKRPNRRYDEYLPSLYSEDGLTTINYYLDISGSVSDGDILRFNSEVKHIHEEFSPEHLNLITFDTKIQDTYHFGPDDTFDGIVVTGRGGTDLRCVRKHIQDTKPNVAVIFSDLYVDPMESVGDIPVLWIVIGNPSAQVPFGQMVHIDNE